MTMNILDRVEASLASFRPGNPAEFVALQLARHFDDLHRLPRYLAATKHHSKRTLLDAAKTALVRHQLNRTPTAELFFEVLAEREKGAHP
jgi:hypothetical protein